MRAASMLAIAMLLAIEVTVSVAKCPDMYKDLQTGCYHFGLEEVHSWEEAFAICQLAMNGYLVEIESQEEQDLLVGYIRTIIDPAGAYAYWMGATDKAKPGEFRWMTSGNMMTFSAWSAGEPNNKGGNEECVAIQKKYDYLWVDYECGGTEYIIGIQRALCETAPL